MYYGYRDDIERGMVLVLLGIVVMALVFLSDLLFNHPAWLETFFFSACGVALLVSFAFPWLCRRSR